MNVIIERLIVKELDIADELFIKRLQKQCCIRLEEDNFFIQMMSELIYHALKHPYKVAPSNQNSSFCSNSGHNGQNAYQTYQCTVLM